MNNNAGFNLFKKLSSFLISYIILPAILVGQAGNAPLQSLPQLPGPFAIDGFLQRQGIGGDWLAGPGGATNFVFTDAGVGLIPISILVRDKYNSASDEVFSKGYLQDDPNTMKWVLRKSANKMDINNILLFAALNPADNHIWLAVGADRRVTATGKISSIDFEFLQNDVLMTGGINSEADRGFYSGGPHGGRTVGDIVVSVTFQNAGSFSTIEYFQWQPGAIPGSYFYFPIIPSPGTAFAASNAGSINVPFGAFGSTTYSPLTFFEAAVDITSLIGGTGIPSCSNSFFIKSVWVKSKSNDNFDDFYPPFQLISTFGTVAVNYFFLDLYTAQLNANVSPQNPDDFNFHWMAMGATDGTVLDPTLTGTLDNYDIPNPIFSADTNYNCIAYIYRVSIAPKTNPTCPVAVADVVINSPCKIGKPINPDQMNHGETIAEESFNDADIISVFPNPSRSASPITLRANNDPKDIALIDINGTIVQRWSATNGNNLKLKGLANGLYLLRITSKKTGNTITKKLVIEN